MAGESIVQLVLDRASQHSTVISRIWLKVLFLLRFLILVLAAETVPGDDQYRFICNTGQLGCTAVCYEHNFPLTLIQYWALQLLLVSTPTMVYLGYVVCLPKEEKIMSQSVCQATQTHSNQDGQRPAYVWIPGRMSGEEDAHGTLNFAHAISVLLKSTFEVGLLLVQWYLFGFSTVQYLQCTESPCPQSVDCLFSNSTKKSIFTLIMTTLSVVALLLNILELFFVFYRRRRLREQQATAPSAPTDTYR